jgi:D-alanyl-D-alanine carboxypeptidase (penicillin-binding protein 5/6)
MIIPKLRYTILFVVSVFLSMTIIAQPDVSIRPNIIPKSPKLPAKAYVLMDANSGQILVQKNMDQKLPPASLTKMMTLYLISQALQNGTITINDKALVSKKAWRMHGSKMFLGAKTRVSVRNLIQGIVVASGNDATVVMAEYIAGNESDFVEMMNAQAKALGLKNTHYVDSSGVSESKEHVTTAHDLALLARALIVDFPDYYASWYKQKWFKYNGIRQPNRNRFLWRYEGADGIKTGHTSQAGFCLVSSAEKNHTRLIAVILGAKSDERRFFESKVLLDYGFRFYDTYLVYQAGSAIAMPRVWYGATKTVPIGITQDLYVTVPAGQFQAVQTQIMVIKNIKAPIAKGQSVGEVVVTLKDEQIVSQSLIALHDDARGSLWRRMIDHIVHFFYDWFHHSA